MPDEDRVLDDELLYRRVPDRPGNYVPTNGSYRVSSAAFGDRKNLQPSVDRAVLRGYNPEKSKRESTDFVVSFTALKVRAIEEFPRIIDVQPDPISGDPVEPDNPAHALIVAHQPFPSNNQEFKRFKRALARLANSNWEISPPNSA